MQGLIIETIAKVRNAGDIMISIARPFSSTLRELASASDVHLRLVQYDGVLCLLGVKPRTDYYGVSLPDKGAHAQIELIQVSQLGRNSRHVVRPTADRIHRCR